MNKKTTILSIIIGFIISILSLKKSSGYSFGHNNIIEKYFKNFIHAYDNHYVLILYPIIFYLTVYLVIEIIKIFKEPISNKNDT
jgi:hypothetical protein